MDWLGKMLGLPEEFLHCSPGAGGGIIQVGGWAAYTAQREGGGEGGIRFGSLCHRNSVTGT